MNAFYDLWNQTRPAFSQVRSFFRTRKLALSALVCLGRRTVSGMLTTAGRQFVDWSADYRIFEQERFRSQGLFDVARRAVGIELPTAEPLVVSMDDTLLRKKGRKVAGAAWRRDPLGPQFQTNLVWSQRFLQISAALPEQQGASRARAIPIDLTHCPSAKKPKQSAPAEEWNEYKQKQKIMRVSAQGAQRIWGLRNSLDQDANGKQRQLVVCADGGFTNETVLKKIPPRTTYIGRIRKDAKLYYLPEGGSKERGRKAVYGEQLPTPEQIRQDESIRWETVEAYAAGKVHAFEVKALGPVRWRAAGGGLNLRLIVIRPLAYRPCKKSKLLYRDPAYLICTDPALSLDKVLQYYVWRWEIEINFRDEKTLLGVGQAQVWTEKAAQSVPQLLVAAYAFLLLSMHRVYGVSSNVFPTPKWRPRNKERRMSTAEGIGMLRAQLWGRALGENNFSGFVESLHRAQKSEKLENQLPAALIYGVG